VRTVPPEHLAAADVSALARAVERQPALRLAWAEWFRSVPAHPDTMTREKLEAVFSAKP